MSELDNIMFTPLYYIVYIVSPTLYITLLLTLGINISLYYYFRS